jgi:hypothetical protein
MTFQITFSSVVSFRHDMSMVHHEAMTSPIRDRLIAPPATLDPW